MPRVRPTLLLLFGTLLAALPDHAVHAEARVQGTVESVRLEARDATVGEILEALHARFGMLYRSTDALSRRVTTTYEGPLRRLLARVLDGNDYVIKTNGTSIEVIVLDSQPGATTRPASVAPSLAPPVRRRRESD